jgi:hypothetical protein
MTPLIIFGDKSHTDLHGALAVTPIIVLQCQILETTSLIPNLGYGKNKADKTYTKDKVQNEHECFSVAFQSIRRIHREEGFRALVLGREVNIKIWVHYFIRDTEGNNKWLGHHMPTKPIVEEIRIVVFFVVVSVVIVVVSVVSVVGVGVVVGVVFVVVLTVIVVVVVVDVVVLAVVVIIALVLIFAVLLLSSSSSFSSSLSLSLSLSSLSSLS